MVENCRSIGAATEAAMVSGLAPGSVAVTSMVGKSTARQRRDRQQPVGEDAEHDDRRRDQRRHHRPADTDFRERHVRTRRCAARGVTLVPLDSSSWPSVTTIVARLEARLDHRLAVDRALDLDRANGRRAALHHEHESCPPG